MARRFASQQLVLVGAPDYLRRHGTPSALHDLAAHRHIVYRLPSSGRDRPQQFRVGRRAIEMYPARSARFSDGEAIVQAALLGLGIAQVPDNMADAELVAGRLVELLAQHRPPAMPIHAVMPAQRLVPGRVRALLDVLHAWDAPAGPASPKTRRSSAAR